MAEQASLAGRTLAGVAGDAVLAGAAVQARPAEAVVHVDLAVLALEAIDADAGVAAVLVGAGGAVLARRVQGTLVHVLCAPGACVAGRALAGVGVDAVQAGAADLAVMAGAVVDVHLTAVTSETCFSLININLCYVFV